MHVALAFVVGLVVGAVLAYVFRAKVAAEEAALTQDIGKVAKKL